MSLARHNIRAPLETLKRGMYLPEREAPAEEHDRKYLKGDEFLMEVPAQYRKVKKSKTTKKGGGRRKGSPSKKSKSPAKKGIKRANSAGSDEMP